MEKLKNKKVWHIVIIVLGITFLLLSAIHTTIWFDETYTVAIAKHSFSEIWSIGSHDVHPVLYYWLLHILYVIFGNNILIYRLFSVLAIAILGIIGYTHIRKDFGEKSGFLFSFFVLFFPLSVVYATEIRMYGFAMLFVSCMCIYAYRIYQQKEKISIKNWILFAIFSLASSYTHYYGLMAAGIVNLILFIYLIIKLKKDAENKKVYKKNFLIFIVQAVIEVVCYLPWLVCLFRQFQAVSKGFWIKTPSLQVLEEMFEFQFSGNLLDFKIIDPILAITLGAILVIFAIRAIVIARKEKDNSVKPAIFAIGVYLLVIIAAAIISIKTPVLYARYLLCITGLLLFFISYLIAKEKNNTIIAVVMTIVIAISLCLQIVQVRTNYAPINEEPIKQIAENIKEGDIFVYGNEGSGFVVSANFPEYKQYFYDGAYWNVDEAYQAYGPNMKIIHKLEELDDYEGRIWVIGADNYVILEEFEERYADNIQIDLKKSYSTKYKKYQYTITLLEKVK